MRLRPLLRKELVWSKRNLAALIVLLLVVPAVFAGASVAFQTVVPTDMPVGVVGAGQDVSDADLSVVEGAVTFFSDPVRYESTEHALEDLRRESVYAVIEIPADVAAQSDGRLELVLYVDGSLVPFRETSKAITSIANARLSATLPVDVRVTRTVLEPTHTLPEFLMPLLLFGVITLFAFTYVPYNLAAERTALDRIRTESSLEALAVSKLVFFTILMAIPVGVFWLVARQFEYSLDILAPGAVAGLLVSFLLMAIVAMTIMFLSRFSTTGRFLNVLVLFGLFALGGLIYPVGFFSPLRRAIARLVPVHYGMIVVRSAMLKSVDILLFDDWLLGLLVVTVVAGVALELSIIAYRRWLS
ncbi:ABC transporter permease [Halorhabdus sp. CUG00001]|uniref:ABC transporter permease n=1 Tax=Halorhabdus sp. CUG00001 TaxID=2600297 RepID=UPI00131C42AF|nr:ABC transporter permease [Halorhabdus sp. CUG00001]